jgi:hypothetical protein
VNRLTDRTTSEISWGSEKRGRHTKYFWRRALSALKAVWKLAMLARIGCEDCPATRNRKLAPNSQTNPNRERNCSVLLAALAALEFSRGFMVLARSPNGRRSKIEDRGSKIEDSEIDRFNPQSSILNPQSSIVDLGPVSSPRHSPASVFSRQSGQNRSPLIGEFVENPEKLVGRIDRDAAPGKADRCMAAPLHFLLREFVNDSFGKKSKMQIAAELTTVRRYLRTHEFVIQP